jgi:NAD(P)-dependent dehydrogenase (short-subunit alcohol dehydrogenase family)
VELLNKIVLIVAASGGIGRAIAKRLSEQGYKIVLAFVNI